MRAGPETRPIVRRGYFGAGGQPGRAPLNPWNVIESATRPMASLPQDEVEHSRVYNRRRLFAHLGCPDS